MGDFKCAKVAGCCHNSGRTGSAFPQTVVTFQFFSMIIHQSRPKKPVWMSKLILSCGHNSVCKNVTLFSSFVGNLF